MKNRPRSQRLPKDKRKAEEMTLDERKFAIQRCCQKLDALTVTGRGSTPDAKRTRHAMFMMAGNELWSALSFARPSHFNEWIEDLT